MSEFKLSGAQMKAVIEVCTLASRMGLNVKHTEGSTPEEALIMISSLVRHAKISAAQLTTAWRVLQMVFKANCNFFNQGYVATVKIDGADGDLRSEKATFTRQDMEDALILGGCAEAANIEFTGITSTTGSFRLRIRGEETSDEAFSLDDLSLVSAIFNVICDKCNNFKKDDN